ncbi:MAG TPA: LuxR C-terminal-related transcriptional regulator, partial [Umezawaea sp.]|nr:LuxR C-terminal-related transcriptional regulator [Umezawaea sp.]
DAAHLKAAQYLHRKHSSAERIARHLVASDVPLEEEWATGVLLQAARTAAADGRTDQALRYLELAATSGAPGSERNQALLELVEVSLKAGAGQGLAKAAAVLRGDCDDEVRLQVLSRLGGALWLVDSDDEHRAVLEVVDTTTTGGGLAAWVPVHEAAVVSECRLPVDFVEHVGRMAAAGPPKPRGHDGAPRATALLGLVASAFVLLDGFLVEDDPVAVVERVETAERLLSDPDDLCVHPVASLAMMAVLLWGGRHDAVEELLRVHRYCHLGRENHPQQLLLSCVEGRILRFRGQMGNATAHLTRCLDDLVGFGVPSDHVLRVLVVGMLADVLVETGDVAAAWKLLKDHQCAGPLPVGRQYGDVLLARARLHAVGGAFPEALEDLREARRRVGDGLVDWSALRWRLVGADLMLQLARYGEARTWAEEQARRAAEVGDVAGRAVALRVLGTVTGGARGEVLLREAAVVLEREQLWFQLAHALSDLGQLLAGEARWEEADALLGRALALADRSGAAPLVARVRDRLSALGASRGGYSALGAVRELTVREKQVLLGAMQGLSNNKLAGDLRITRRTVEIHLSNSYRKLGIRGRKEFDRLFGVPGFWSLMLDGAANRDESGQPRG